MAYYTQTAGYKDLLVGATKEVYGEFEPVYTMGKAGMKIGEVMAYSGDIGLSRVIQNYNATKSNYDDSEKI